MKASTSPARSQALACTLVALFALGLLVSPPLAAADPPITSLPSPADPGPHPVCFDDYEVDGTVGHGTGRFHVPALEILRDGTCLIDGGFPLLLIAHADGQGSDGSVAHTKYDELAYHLASHGIVVSSMNRNGVGPTDFDILLVDHLDYLYTASDIQGILLDDIAILGHSAGGRSVLRNASVVHAQTTKTLKAVILLATTIDLAFSTNFDGDTGAFLGINVVLDSDANAFGPKTPGAIMQSTFKVYDEAGVLPALPDLSAVEKDMVFANGSDLGVSAHYFQNAGFSKGYINAFLQIHLNGHGIFRRFFKQQEKVPKVDTQVFLQHGEPSQLTVANFENGDESQHTLGGDIIVTGDSIVNAQVGEAHLLDDFSPHHTQVLRFDWLGATPGGGADRLRFEFNAPLNVKTFRYISLRITQVYDPVANATGTGRDFSVRLHTLGGDAAQAVSAHGGALHFPVVALAPAGAGQAEQTKNAMRTYLIPLSAFAGVDLSAVTEMALDFGDAGGTATTFQLDDVAFWF